MLLKQYWSVIDVIKQYWSVIDLVVKQIILLVTY